MAALTPTVVRKTEFAGNQKIKIITVTPSTATDTVDLSSYFTTIDMALPVIIAGADAALQTVEPSISSTTLTLYTFASGGTVATDWTGASIKVLLIGEE